MDAIKNIFRANASILLKKYCEKAYAGSTCDLDFYNEGVTLYAKIRHGYQNDDLGVSYKQVWYKGLSDGTPIEITMDSATKANLKKDI